MKSQARFWGSALGVALGFAALAPLLFPFRALGLDPAADRERVWLLLVFAGGVMALLLGASAALGGRWMGLREVLEAGSAGAALERQRQLRRELRAAGWRNAGVWTMALGASLVAIYFVLWKLL
jgi:hypothetical protein